MEYPAPKSCVCSYGDVELIEECYREQHHEHENEDDLSKDQIQCLQVHILGYQGSAWMNGLVFSLVAVVVVVIVG